MDYQRNSIRPTATDAIADNRITTASTKKRLISLGAHRYRNVHHRRAFSWDWFIVNVAKPPSRQRLINFRTSKLHFGLPKLHAFRYNAFIEVC